MKFGDLPSLLLPCSRPQKQERGENQLGGFHAMFLTEMFIFMFYPNVQYFKPLLLLNKKGRANDPASY